MKTISILGSTGSIGTQAIEITKMHNIKVVALSANSNVKLLASQAIDLRVECVCIYDETKRDELSELLAGFPIKILTGRVGLCEIATMKVDIMLNSVVGMVGLKPTLMAIECGTDIALANKETLVTGGKLVINRAKEKNVKILPVDSEHSAIFQCLQGNEMNKIKKIILTASGGPFFNKKKSDLKNITVEQALHHPNWSMGNKITIDSSTLMNKGLEFIEAMWLFDLEPEQIEIVVHRESVLHSAVEYEDGSVIAQMGVPDMRLPIQYALMYPNRVECKEKELSLTDYGSLSFYKPDYEIFDCLRACIKAITAGGRMPAVVNGANEQAVALFLDKKIPFLKIGELVMSAYENIENKEIKSLDDVIEADKIARQYVLDNV